MRAKETLNFTSRSPGLTALIARRWIAPRHLAPPGPNHEQRLQIAAAVAAAPDHGRKRPCRLLHIPDDRRKDLARAFVAAALERDPAIGPDEQDRQRAKALNGAVLLAVIARIDAGDAAIPAEEQWVAVGAAVQNAWLAAEALGFRAGLVSGPAVRTAALGTALGLAGGERLVGFLAIGTPARQAKPGRRPEPEEVLADWLPAASAEPAVEAAPVEGLALERVAAHIAALVQPVADTRTVALAEADGAMLARPIEAPSALPPFDHAAVDGYALPAEALAADGAPIPLGPAGRAGRVPAPLQPGTAAPILTGAPIPPGTAAVVMQEHAEPADGLLRLTDRVRAGANIRRQGEDVAAGERVLAAGTRLDARHVALLAALGLRQVTVARPLTAAVLAFGDELVAPGEARRGAQVYDSNSAMAVSLLQRWGIAVAAQQRIADRDAAAVEALATLGEAVDLVVASGGMGPGEADRTRAAVVAAGGSWSLLSIRMKPGKPVGLGRVGRARVVGLPGNPFAALVALLVVGRPLATALQGGRPDGGPLPARAGFTLARRPGRAELFPARLMPDGGSVPTLDRLGRGGSARLKPLLAADGLGVIAAEAAAVAPGDPLGFLPFGGLL